MMDRFKNAPIHNKSGIINMMDEFTPEQMVDAVKQLHIIRDNGKVESLSKYGEEELKSKYDDNFRNVYRVTKVITPNKIGMTPTVGREYHGQLTESGLVVSNPEYRGHYYVVECELVWESDSYAEYIEGVDKGSLDEYGQMMFDDMYINRYT
jgi:hypothetical protein